MPETPSDHAWNFVNSFADGRQKREQENTQTPATEEEAQEFSNYFCDYTFREDHINKEYDRAVIVALLAAENAQENGEDLSTIEGKQKFADDVYWLTYTFNNLSKEIASEKRTLTKEEYLTYMGALWRSVDEATIEQMYCNNQEKLEKVLEVRNFRGQRDV